MKKLLFTSFLILGTLNLGHAHEYTHAHAVLINNDGDTVGYAAFQQGAHGVVIRIDVEGLPPGIHGMHFHEVGTCEDCECFKLTKGHIAPSGKPHGFFNPDGPHEGNLPNLIVNEEGRAFVELYSDLVSISGQDGKPALLDEDGSTLIVHANEDDHYSQPIGGSGARILCGVIEPNIEDIEEEGDN